jgi:hypothetical protein
VRHERRAHRDLALLVKLPADVAQHEARLADAAVAQQHQLYARRGAARRDLLLVLLLARPRDVGAREAAGRCAP